MNYLRLRATPPALTVADAELVEQMTKEGATFSSVDLRTPGALPVFVLNIAQKGWSDRPVTCDTEPCAPETLAADFTDITARVLVVRDGAKTALIREENFTGALGTVDSKEKAAARAALDRRPMSLAQCADLTAFGAPCAPESRADGVAVRAAEGGGYDVVLFGYTNVCSDHQNGEGLALEVVHVSPTGELTSLEESALVRGSRLAALSAGVECSTPMLGRMFEGYEDLPVGLDLRAHLLRAARQESAAVHAFARLAQELASFGAPPALVAAATRGAEDETRHAALFTRAIAGLDAADGETTKLDLATPPETWRARSLFEVLLENAIEGCANETYAAVVATHQAEAADGAPAALRPLFAAIAEDERAHAALGFEIHRWGRSRLTAGERAALDAAVLGAIARMRTARPSNVGLALGEPREGIASRAFDGVVAALHGMHGRVAIGWRQP